MIQKKIALIVLGIILCISVLIILKNRYGTINKAEFTIGILQTVSHPALDNVREGFMRELKNKLGDDVNFIVQNAEGSTAHAQSIARSFHANKNVNGILAIATLAAQVMANVEKEKPIFISAVTDPGVLGIIHPKTNVCGISDMIDVSAEIEMLKRLLPDVKTVALLFNPGEINSVVMADKMKSELKKSGIAIVEMGLTSEVDVPNAVSIACKKSDAILVPLDNTVASTIQLISKLTLKAGIPFIVSDNLLVKNGALAARGVDYIQCGEQAAIMAFKVLCEDKKPADLGIERPKSDTIFINKKTLNKLKLNVPEKLNGKIVFVES